MRGAGPGRRRSGSRPRRGRRTPRRSGRRGVDGSNSVIAVLHRGDLAAHPDAQPVAGAQADGAIVDALGRGDARVPVLALAKSATKAKASSRGRAVSIVSCSLVMLVSVSSSSGPVILFRARRTKGRVASEWTCDPLIARRRPAEVSVVGSFSRVGLPGPSKAIRMGSPADGSLAGRTVRRHGADVRAGRAAAGCVAALGARVVLVGRTRAAGARPRASCRRDARRGRPDRRRGHGVAGVGARGGRDGSCEREPRLDVVVDNAGAICPETRELTPDGIERTLATMVRGPVRAGRRGCCRCWRTSPDAPARRGDVGRHVHAALPLDDLAFESGTYSGPRAYARAKRAQVALVREWARRLAGRGIVAQRHAPGLGRHAGPRRVAARASTG